MKRLGRGFRPALCFAAATAVAGAAAPDGASAPVLRREDVERSLQEYGAGWEQKIVALGRPRIYLAQGGREKLERNLASDPALRQALLDAAREAARRPIRGYASVEEVMRRSHATLYRALGEAWEMDVANDLWALEYGAIIDDSASLREALKRKVLAACSYPTWGRGQENQAQEGPNMDLTAASLISAVSLAWDWFPSLWSPLDRERIKSAIREKAHATLAGLYGAAYWSRLQGYNHNQISVQALAMAGNAFYRDLPEAPEWLAAARLDYLTVARLLRPDGEFGEGLSYWSYGLDAILRYIEATRDVIDSGELYRTQFMRNAGQFRLAGSTSGFDGVLPWGDAYERDFYGPHHLLCRLGDAAGDPHAQWLAGRLPFGLQSASDENFFLALWRNPAAPAAPPASLDDHAWIGDIATTRSGWGGGDYVVSLKSGWNNGNHTHLDAGALALAIGYDWLLTSPGRGLGAGDSAFWNTTGPRWGYFSNATEAESTLLIDGENQRFDPQARGTIDAFLSTPGWAWMSDDLTAAYPRVTAVRRSVLHRRGDYILVFDELDSPLPRKVEWLAQLAPPVLASGRGLEVAGDSGALHLEMLEPRAAFERRAPTVPRVDVPAQVIATYAVAQTGTNLRFIGLLQPSYGGRAAPSLTTSFAAAPDGARRLTLRGPGWIDSVAWRPQPGNLAGETISARARRLAWRNDPEGVESCVADQATHLEIDGLSLTADRPAEIGLQRIGRHSWILDLDRKREDAIDIQGGGEPTPLDLPDADGQARGRSFRYLLQREGSGVPEAQAWLAAQRRTAPAIPLPVRVPPPLPSAPRAARIEVEGEDYAWQRVGAGAQIDRAPGASAGKVLRSLGPSGYGNGGHHSVTWLFRVTEPGVYHLRMRYEAERANYLAVLIDGAAQNPASLRIRVAATGGRSGSVDHWEESALCDPHTGRPLDFALTAGPHTLHLGEISDVLAVDTFTFEGAGDR